MLLFNFSTITDAVSANYFFIFKNHNVFSLNYFSTNLSNTIMFYIIFFTSSSFIFLLNMRYNFNYFYLNAVFFFDVLFLFFILFLFFNFYLGTIFTFLFFYFLYKTKKII
jgi:hypothetical protein